MSSTHSSQEEAKALGEKLLEQLRRSIKNEVNSDAPQSRVFISHGYDEKAKQAIASFVMKLGLNPIMLHEQPNMGRTIIEKFEDNSADFAIILLTPDEIGTSRRKTEKSRPRARQNVIFELGYFVGRLGRNRVIVLYKEGVEIPSDYQGLLYIPMDAAGAWQKTLAKEIKNAGIEVDLNRVL